MACGGFTCTKNTLILLNLIYIVVSFLLIGFAAYWSKANLVTSVPVIGGIIACGVLLLLISILGILGAIWHHQVQLFFYMVILFLLFLVQFSIACACLALDKKAQENLAKTGWQKSGESLKMEVQETFQCCGFDTNTMNHTTMKTDNMAHPSCAKVTKCCPDKSKEEDCCAEGKTDSCKCDPCFPALQEKIERGLRTCGGIGLFFSFTEFIGVWLTIRYRNQKDPRANPSAFL